MKKSITSYEFTESDIDNFLYDILDLLKYENEILKKVENEEKLSFKEYYFIKYCVSPTLVAKHFLEKFDKK